jgi:hypothetical protein
VQVTYDHLGAPPRDPVPWRVNEAYAGFVAFGLGDEGQVTLRISQPFGYEFDEFTDLAGFEVSEPDPFGTVVHTRSGLSQDTRITVGMANDDRLVSRPLDVDGVDLQLRSWPDDPEWADFAAATVERGLPALEELIGIEWPIEGSFDVRQTVEPTLSGYAGWFDAASNEIAVGEALDADTIYHELSHAWFNRRLSPERWVTEGFAQTYAAELVRRDGAEARVPSEPDVENPFARPLTEWTALDTERAVEEYGYTTSFWVVDALVDEIGFDRTRDVIASAPDRHQPVRRHHRRRATGRGLEARVRRLRRDRRLERSHVTSSSPMSSTPTAPRRSIDELSPLPTSTHLEDSQLAMGAPCRAAQPTRTMGVRRRRRRTVTAADRVLEQRSALESIESSVGIEEPAPGRRGVRRRHR